ncbi:MAG: hypothetical protein PHU78_09480, partial [Heliobacteriaceae bacterium]|nr:hypothetical protein [Heliobacteriaceae bacterium]
WVSVRYWLDSGGNVQRSEGLDTKPLAAGIAALTFARVPVCPEAPQVCLIQVAVKQKPHGRNYLAGVECITQVLPRSEIP